jgi:hypothetical protein
VHRSLVLRHRAQHETKSYPQEHFPGIVVADGPSITPDTPLDNTKVRQSLA